MPFVKDDPRINRSGRPTDDERFAKKTNRELRQRELLLLLRKFKPHVASAVMRAVDVMDDKEAAHQNQLKAATIILDNYRKLVIDLYGDDVDGDEEGVPVQEENKPIFSMKVVDFTKQDTEE